MEIKITPKGVNRRLGRWDQQSWLLWKGSITGERVVRYREARELSNESLDEDLSVEYSVDNASGKTRGDGKR